MSGTAAGNTLTGTAGRDVIYGLAGNDTIDGGGSADRMLGGLGNDTYIVDDAGDAIVELANEGTDLVKASVSYTLAANVENLTLSGTGAINATGNELANKLTGNAGDNRLDGGFGADTLVGGAGNDTYVVDDVADKVTEVLDEGDDSVLASVSYTLAANVENLILTGTTAINGTGNSLANQLTGNAADNTLNGGGGPDTLVGGDGNDTYIVNLGDTIMEAANGGIDAVKSNINWVLAAYVENLTLTGSGNTHGTGNSLNNVITGNSGANTLDGGVGADTLIGGAGNDTYVLDDAGDQIIEATDEGNDTVQTSMSYTLGSNLENLTLTGSAAINATGNERANKLTGNAADNRLDGGAGADTLVGGAGNDTYIVDDIGDKVTEVLNEGNDTVLASELHPGSQCGKPHFDWHECHQRHRQLTGQQHHRKFGRQHPQRWRWCRHSDWWRRQRYLRCRDRRHDCGGGQRRNGHRAKQCQLGVGDQCREPAAYRHGFHQRHR